MDKLEKTDTKDKIILPENLQREMMKFFLEASRKNNANNAKHDKETPATPIESKE